MSVLNVLTNISTEVQTSTPYSATVTVPYSAMTSISVIVRVLQPSDRPPAKFLSFVAASTQGTLAASSGWTCQVPADMLFVDYASPSNLNNMTCGVASSTAPFTFTRRGSNKAATEHILLLYADAQNVSLTANAECAQCAINISKLFTVYAVKQERLELKLL